MSVRAKKLIAQNKRTQEPFLDLGNCYLSEIPPEITQLTWLRSLNLGSDWLEFHDGIRQFKVSQNTGRENKRLASIAVLSQLPLLQSLIVSGT